MVTKSLRQTPLFHERNVDQVHDEEEAEQAQQRPGAEEDRLTQEMQKPPTIIGLRTWRYTPRTTSFCGGFQGAGVPFPTVTKSPMVQAMRISPTITNTEPTTGKAMFHGNGGQPTPVK